MIANIQLRRDDNTWSKIKDSSKIAVYYQHQSSEKQEGIYLALDPASEGGAQLPKRLRRLLLSASGAVNFGKRESNAILLTLPGSQGYLELLATFQSEADANAFSASILSVGQPKERHQPKSKEPSASSSSAISSSSSKENIENHSTAAPKKRSREEVTSQTQQGAQGAGEDDDEVDTEPQEYPAVARSTITSVIKKSASTPSGAYERLDLGDPVTKTYVQSLLSGDDENFNSFTDDLEIMLAKRPRLSSPKIDFRPNA